MFELLEKAGILVWPILFCSLAGLTIFFERLLTFRSVGRSDEAIGKAFALLQEGSVAKAGEYLRAGKKHKRHVFPEERILLEAIAVADTDLETMEMVLMHAVDREMKRLARYLSTLATMGNVAPLLGLLGTVMGMIRAFSVVEEMGGRVNASVLAGGIWEAMLTTAFGLSVAIPLIILHNYLEGKLDAIQASLEEVAVSFLKVWLSASTKGN